MKVIVSGPDDHGLASALTALGVETIRLEGSATRASLLDASLDEADALVLTDMDDASAIPVAKDECPDLQVVTYAEDSLPEFARGQTDLAIDPNLLAADVVAEELAA